MIKTNLDRPAAEIKIFSRTLDVLVSIIYAKVGFNLIILDFLSSPQRYWFFLFFQIIETKIIEYNADDNQKDSDNI